MNEFVTRSESRSVTAHGIFNNIDYDDIDMEIDDVLDDAKTITLNEKLKVTQTGSQFNIKWGRIKQADGYDIYVQRCGKNFKSKPTKTVKGNKKTSIKVKKLDGKKLILQRVTKFVSSLTNM